MKVFDDNFTSEIKKVLDQHCIEGKCIKASDVCQILNLDEKEYRPLISAMIRIGSLPEYRSYKGVGRGIGRVDIPPPKTSRKNYNPKPMFIPDHFLDELEEVLERLCEDGSSVTRKEIVEEMETAVDKNSEAMISAAIKLERFADYGIKKGPKGGVYLKSSNNDKEEDSIPEIEEKDSSSGIDDFDQVISDEPIFSEEKTTSEAFV